jgi:hypothetical protein
VAPRCIDILTSIDGVEFDEAWSQRQIIEVEEQIFSVISRVQLLQNKKASGQRKDLADVAWRESEHHEATKPAEAGFVIALTKSQVPGFGCLPRSHPQSRSG